ncbi:MAG: thioredoxin domain-containing protein [Nanoarchaeota archaeon]|nr:thioredoxin domain-containing protein [Nanoarchaeota archaeon]
MLRKKFWKIATFALLGLLILSLIFNPFHKKMELPASEVKGIVDNFLSSYIIGAQHEVEITNVEERSSFYKLDVKVDGVLSESYVSKDGQYFFPYGMNIHTIERTAQFDEYYEIDTSDDPFLGEPNAPVKVIAFLDYQSPDSKKFIDEFLPRLKEVYIDQNKVQFIQKNKPIMRLHQFAFDAAAASECAYKQGKFWEYNYILFEKSPLLNNAELREYASDLDLDLFSACLENEGIEAVNADLLEAEKSETVEDATFFINGRKVYGIELFEVFAQIVEDEYGIAMGL